MFRVTRAVISTISLARGITIASQESAAPVVPPKTVGAGRALGQHEPANLAAGVVDDDLHVVGTLATCSKTLLQLRFARPCRRRF
jgi:hypothetical protein